MKLQKATLFALFAVLELARDPSRQVSAAEIAEIYGVSVNHLAKVMRDLGLVKFDEPFLRLMTQGMLLNHVWFRRSDRGGIDYISPEDVDPVHDVEGRVLGGGVGLAVLGYSHHLHAETLLDLGHAGAGVDAGPVGRHLLDLVSLIL